MSSKTNAWIKAFRLRTLPLAIASIGMGGFLAGGYGNFKLEIFLLCILTTVLLQVLSNLANDYGDSDRYRGGGTVRFGCEHWDAG